MKEIGGYIELENFRGIEYHKDAVALNCGRNCLAYILLARKITKISLPYFLCDSVENTCRKYNVQIRYYRINSQFMPVEFSLNKDEWIFIVNYYGQLNDEIISNLRNNYENRVIIDNTQAFFARPVHGIDTIYTCRKFFGVPDGAYLYTDAELNVTEQDVSYKRMNFLLGRFEKSANEFYNEYVENNALFENEPIKKMSELTHNLLRGVDYNLISQVRTENFICLQNELKAINKLKLTVPEGAFMYPLYIDNGAEIRKQLQKEKIYIPTLWPAVFDICSENDLEYDLANNILPLPVDQRYNTDDMKYMSELIKRII